MPSAEENRVKAKKDAKKCVLAQLTAGKWTMAPGAGGTAELSLLTWRQISSAYLDKSRLTTMKEVGQVPQKRTHCASPVTCAVRFLTSAGQQSGSSHAECVLSTALNAHKGANVVSQFQREQRFAPCFGWRVSPFGVIV